MDLVKVDLVKVWVYYASRGISMYLSDVEKMAMMSPRSFLGAVKELPPLSIFFFPSQVVLDVQV